MGIKHINTFIGRQMIVPTKTTGEKLYDLLGVNPKNELIILIKPHDPIFNQKYLIVPDNKLIEFPTDNILSRLPEYMVMILKNELFFEMFYLRTTYPN